MADNNCYFPAVAHSAYYSCVHLMQHIWFHKMNKSRADLNSGSTGMHNVLINQVGILIKSNPTNRNALNDFRIYNEKIGQLKKLRTNADYTEDSFDITKSRKSIDLAERLIPILKKA